MTSRVISAVGSCDALSQDAGVDVPFVEENSGVVSLRFNNLEIQSAMHKHAPNRLMLRYTRTMMRFLEFNAQPRHIGMIGLGGGSMAKYCHHHLPDTRLSIAEINPDVIALRDQFQIPLDDDRLKIHCEDGAFFVRRQAGVFDVLLVDGFDNAGQPPQLCSQQFYNHCYRSLTSTGLFVVNLAGDEHPVPRIRRSFRNHVVVVGGNNKSSNVIVFASKGNDTQLCGVSTDCSAVREPAVTAIHRL